MRKIFVCILVVLFANFAYGQSCADSVKVYFHLSQWQFDPALRDNAASMDAFIERVRHAAETQTLDHIVVRGYASPEGTEKFNNRLSAERCATMAALIESGAGLSPEFVETIPEGVSWEELRRMVAATPGVPAREQILNILDNTPVWVFNSKGRVVDGRKKQLMDLRGGRPWHWLSENIFPQLRYAVAVSLYLRADSDNLNNLNDLNDLNNLNNLNDSNNLKDLNDLNNLNNLNDLNDLTDSTTQQLNDLNNLNNPDHTPDPPRFFAY